MTTHRWRWSKPVRWADIDRSNQMTLGTTSNQNWQNLMRGIEAGRVEKVGYGLYRLAQPPSDGWTVREGF